MKQKLIAVCSACGSPVEYDDGDEFAYCPMCENDQVEIKQNQKSSIIDKLSVVLDNVAKLKGITTEELEPLDDYCIQGGYINHYLAVKQLAKLLKEQQVSILVNDNINKEDLDYLFKLIDDV